MTPLLFFGYLKSVKLSTGLQPTLFFNVLHFLRCSGWGVGLLHLAALFNSRYGQEKKTHFRRPFARRRNTSEFYSYKIKKLSLQQFGAGVKVQVSYTLERIYEQCGMCREIAHVRMQHRQLRKRRGYFRNQKIYAISLKQPEIIFI